MSKIKRNGTKPQVLSAREAVEYIADQQFPVQAVESLIPMH